MRAVALSHDRVIKFLNENFINTWATNAELGRKPQLRDPIAKRRDRESKVFDTTSPLVQAIMKGWKKDSPVDCLVISPDFELKGQLPLNEYSTHAVDGGRTAAENYRLFLVESLEGKLPGLSRENSFRYLFGEVEDSSVEPLLSDLNVVLNSIQPSLEVLDIFGSLAPGCPGYTVVKIDVTAFETGGTLAIDIRVGGAEKGGSFYLYDVDVEIPTERGERYYHSFANATDMPPNGAAEIRYPFYRSQVFKLVIAAAAENGEGSVNAFQARISVEQTS